MKQRNNGLCWTFKLENGNGGYRDKWKFGGDWMLTNNEWQGHCQRKDKTT